MLLVVRFSLQLFFVLLAEAAEFRKSTLVLFLVFLEEAKINSECRLRHARMAAAHCLVQLGVARFVVYHAKLRRVFG